MESAGGIHASGFSSWGAEQGIGEGVAGSDNPQLERGTGCCHASATAIRLSIEPVQSDPDAARFHEDPDFVFS